MTEYFEKNLFEHISMEEYKKLLPCLNARNRSFLPGETLCRYDSTLHQLGIMGTGTASVVRYEYNGARTILERLGPRCQRCLRGPMRSTVFGVQQDQCPLHQGLRLPPSADPEPFNACFQPCLKFKPPGRGAVTAHYPRKAAVLL